MPLKHNLYLVKWGIDGDPDSPMEKGFMSYNDAVAFADKTLKPKDDGVIYELARLAHFKDKRKDG